MRFISPYSFVVFALVCLSGVALFHTSRSVQRGEARIEALRDSIEREEEQIRMLKAEWANLNNPDRIENMAQQFLDLAPPSSDSLLRQEEAVFPEKQPDPDHPTQPVSFGRARKGGAP